MYRLTKLKLHNICQHSDLEHDISEGISAIVGPNGCGKTSVMRGLVYALTGLVDGSWGTQQTLQKDGTADVGYAEAGFTDGEHEYSVRRFSTSNIKFADAVTKDGVIVAQKRQKVNDFMEQVFGISVQLMFQVCWGRQGELAQLLKGTASTVSTFLTQVFDMKPLERIREKLKLQIDRIAQLPSTCVDTLARDKEALAALPDEASLVSAVAEHEKRVNALRSAKADLEKLILGAAPTSELRLQLTQQTDAIRRELSGYYDEPPVIEEADVPELSDIEAALDDVSREYQDKSVLAKTAQIESDGHAHKCSLLTSQIDAITKRVDEIRASGEFFPKECPLCGGAITNPEQFADRLSALHGSSLSELESKLKELTEELKETTEKWQEASTRHGKLHEELVRIEAEISYDQNNRKLRNYYDLRKNLVYLEDQLNKADKDMVDADAAKVALYAIDKHLEVSASALQQATQALADNRAMRSMLTTAVADGEKVVAQYEVNKEAREVFTELRDVFSQSRAQARYLKARIAQLNRYLAHYVSLTEMPFTLRLDDDTRTFMFTTADGYDHPASHLSGAQQAMSAVALQMALFQVMTPNMNLYLIDEPTEALDNENKLIMASMFDRMNRMLPAVSGTMLIVTRDEPLIQTCNETIDLQMV